MVLKSVFNIKGVEIRVISAGVFSEWACCDFPKKIIINQSWIAWFHNHDIAKMRQIWEKLISDTKSDWEYKISYLTVLKLARESDEECNVTDKNIILLQIVCRKVSQMNT